MAAGGGVVGAEGLPLSACFYIALLLPVGCVNDPKPLVTSEVFHVVISTNLRVKGRMERCIGG
jgi:hypothetical protein